MKIIVLSLLLLSLSMTIFSQVLNNPESVVVVTRDNYYHDLYVSNVGNGQILKKADGDSIYTVFADGLGSVRGLCTNENILYASCNLGLARFDLTTFQSLGTVTIPTSIFLNDVVADSSGNIYMSDGQANKIFKYDITSGIATTFISSGVQNPNGMAFDAPNNRLLLVSYRVNSPIQAIQLPDGEVSTVLTTNIGNLDGIGIDPVGAIYFSSWQTNSIYRLADLTSTPVQIWSGFSGPADFYIYSRFNYYYNYYNDCRIIIPCMTSNSISDYAIPNLINNISVYYVFNGESGDTPYGYIDWRVDFEYMVLGYNIYYSESVTYPSFENAVLLTPDPLPALNGTGYQEYSYDYDDYAPFWWLEIVEFSGLRHHFGPINVIPVAIEDAVQTPPVQDVCVFPNPIKHNTVVTLKAERNTKAEFTMYDIKGRKISQTVTQQLKSGSNQIQLSLLIRDIGRLSAGVYFIQIEAEGKDVKQRFIKY